jgi:hypothetical protein
MPNKKIAACYWCRMRAGGGERAADMLFGAVYEARDYCPVPSRPPSSLLPQARRRRALSPTHMCPARWRRGCSLTYITHVVRLWLGCRPRSRPTFVRHSCHPSFLPARRPLLTSPQRASASAADAHFNAHALLWVSVSPSTLTDLVLQLRSVRIFYTLQYGAVYRLLTSCSVKLAAMPIRRALASPRAFASHLRAARPRCLRILQQILPGLHISLMHSTSCAGLHLRSPATRPVVSHQRSHPSAVRPAVPAPTPQQSDHALSR